MNRVEEKAITRSSDLTKVEAAFVAGFFDAEGIFVIRDEERYYRLVMSFYNNDPVSLVNIQNLIGGSLRPVSRKKRSDKHAPSYILDFPMETIREVISKFEDLLILKKDQARIMLLAEGVRACERAKYRDSIISLNQKAACKLLERSTKQCDLDAPTAAEWSYLAGYLEGDGNFFFQPQRWRGNRYYYPWITAYSTKSEPLRWIHDRFGGTLKFRERKSNWSNEGCVKWTDQKYVALILKNLIPYLKTKREVASLLLEATSFPARERTPFRQEFDEKFSKTAR